MEAEDEKMDEKIKRGGKKGKRNKMKGFVAMAILSFLMINLVTIFYGNDNIARGKTTDYGLVAEWHFDEGYGNIVHDYSGNGNDGTIYGATWVNGIHGKALYFDGENDYVKIYNTHILDTPDYISYEAWVKTSYDITTEQRIIAKHHNHYGNGYWVDVYNGKLRARIYTGNTANPELYADTQPNTWFYVAVTYDGNQIRFYVNGVLMASTIAHGDIDTNNYNLLIGAANFFDGPINYFHGIIDEVRIYNRALSPSEIQQHYNEYKQPSGLVAEWHFDEGYGNIVHDSSRNGNDGTIYGATWVDGIHGKALYFDGENDYVKVPESSSLYFSNEVTIEMWVKWYTLGTSTLIRQGTKEDIKFAIGYDAYGGGYETCPGKGPQFAVNFEGSMEQVEGCEDVTPYEWYQIVGVYDGTYLRIYYNSIEKNEAYVGKVAEGGTAPIFIGLERNFDYYFHGIIDEVRIYNRALSPSEIQQHYNEYKQPSGLVAEWHFDEGYGNIVHDSSRNGNDGTIYGATWVDGIHGKALYFDGVNDYVFIDDSNYWRPLDVFTWTVWVKPENNGGPIMGRSGPAGDPPYDTIMWCKNNFNAYVEIGSANYGVVGSTVPQSGKWYFVAFVWDSTNDVSKLYVNGVLEDSNVAPGSSHHYDDFYIGRGYAYQDLHHFHGIIDEGRIYNRALSASEIQQHYNEYMPSNNPPTVAITYPSDGDVVSGTLSIQGNAFDSDGTIQKVEIKIDNNAWNIAAGTNSWNYVLDTTKFGNGWHTIYARSYDGYDYSSIEYIDVRVNNPTPSKPDLYIDDSDISFSNLSPNDGEEVTIYAVVHNKGGHDAIANVKFYDGNPYATNNPSQLLIGINSVLIKAYDSSITSEKWIAVHGNHTIYVVVSDSQPAEETESNNVAYNTLSVGTGLQPLLRITLGQFDVVTIKEGKARDIPVKIYCYNSAVRNVYIKILEDSNLTVVPITPNMNLNPWEQRDYLINIKVPKLGKNVTVGSKTILIQAVGDNGVASNTENITAIITKSKGIPAFTTALAITGTSLGALMAFFRRRYRNR